MNEIEKMYENAGIEYNRCRCALKPEYCKYKKCLDCDCFFVVPFTAEKQINLIKWLSSKCGIYIVDKYSIGFGECIRDFCIKENFEEALAESINHLWQDLTEEERNQIKDILE